MMKIIGKVQIAIERTNCTAHIAEHLNRVMTGSIETWSGPDNHGAISIS